jgi:uncharacterized membrane protein YhaH (DUF805 family)
MDRTWYVFGFQGRINRARCWLAGLIILCWMACLVMLMEAVTYFVSGKTVAFGFDLNDIFRVVDPDSFRALSSTDLVSLLFQIIGTPLFLWVYLATSIKRLHDRDKSGWWMVPFFVAPGLCSQFADRLGDTIVAMLIGAAAVAFSIWGIVEMYFRKGTKGPNRFGSDPLAPVAAADTRPAWDQHDELEFVPHGAGPSAGAHVKRGP